VPDRGFAAFLDASFAALRRELPDLHGELCAALAPREVALAVDRELVALRFERSHARLLPEPRRPAVEVHTSRAAILALVDAEETLLEAVLGDRLSLRGSPADLLTFHDGLMLYLHGAVRAPSFPGLLRAFRRSRLEEA
jgi:hypothetical protein